MRYKVRVKVWTDQRLLEEEVVEAVLSQGLQNNYRKSRRRKT